MENLFDVMCDILVVYLLADYIPIGNANRQSGTELAMKYAVKKGKNIINYAK
ncbi:MAG: hypothetical protein ACI4QI_01125 [Candidatus Coproplasma sp.]